MVIESLSFRIKVWMKLCIENQPRDFDDKKKVRMIDFFMIYYLICYDNILYY